MAEQRLADLEIGGGLPLAQAGAAAQLGQNLGKAFVVVHIYISPKIDYSLYIIPMMPRFVNRNLPKCLKNFLRSDKVIYGFFGDINRTVWRKNKHV